MLATILAHGNCAKCAACLQDGVRMTVYMQTRIIKSARCARTVGKKGKRALTHRRIDDRQRKFAPREDC